MVKIIELYLVTILLAGCSAYSRTTESSDSTGLVDNFRLESIPLELTTHLGDQQLFVSGDEIQFLLSLGQDAYIYMYYINATNNISQILPNENQQSNFYKAGYFLTIPEYENLYRFTISKPFGNESVWVFASDQSMPLNNNHDSIDSIKENIKQESRQAYGEYVLKITTRKK